MKKIDEVKQRLEQLKAQAKTLLDTEGTTLEAIKDIKNKINIEQEKLETLEAMNKVPTVPTGSKLETGTEEEKEKQYLISTGTILVLADDIKEEIPIVDVEEKEIEETPVVDIEEEKKSKNGRKKIAE